ncbi:MAG: response regulator transcription factor [Ktedonobacteraceae bacterium]
MTIRVLIVDDHCVVRQGLRVFLGLDPELEVLASEATHGEEALCMARQYQPDVVLMDLIMPGMDGIAATESIRRELPKTEVVVLTSVLEDAQVIAAVRAGAIGYLLKDTQADEICRAIKAAAAGQVHLAPQAALRLMRDVQLFQRPETLTERETDVLQLLTQGASNKDIANKLSLGEKTVKTHISSILSKLGVQSRTQAALLAVRLKLVSPPSSQSPELMAYPSAKVWKRA